MKRLLPLLLLTGCQGMTSKIELSSLTAPVAPVSVTQRTSGSDVGVVNRFNALQTFAAATETLPSTKTAAVYAARGQGFTRGQLLPLSSEPSALNSPALVTFMIATAEHCNDLVSTEEKLPSANRKFLGEINLAAGAPKINGGALTQVAERFSTKFYRRVLTPDEASAVATLSEEILTQSLNNKQMILTLCTGMLASVASLSR